jgi:hypothetical protein
VKLGFEGFVGFGLLTGAHRLRRFRKSARSITVTSGSRPDPALAYGGIPR